MIIAGDVSNKTDFTVEKSGDSEYNVFYGKVRDGAADIIFASSYLASMSVTKCILFSGQSRGRSDSHPCSVTPLGYIHVPSPLPSSTLN